MLTPIYRFGSDVVDGDGSMTEVLGRKGAELAEMSRLRIPVPPGFTLPTAVYRSYIRRGLLPENFTQDLNRAVARLQEQAGRKLGNAHDPLMVSVRAGVPASAKGVAATVLNLGLNDKCVRGLARSSQLLFALDCYQRLLQMFGILVFGIEKEAFEEARAEVNSAYSQQIEGERSELVLCLLVASFKAVIEQYSGHSFPQEPVLQLRMAIEAIFRLKKSQFETSHPSEFLGIAVTVQAMAFGNIDDDSGIGVGFTHMSPSGKACLGGKYLANAQGEDIVAGDRAPMQISQLAVHQPSIYFKLLELAESLGRRYEHVDQFKFTVERGELFLLQARGKVLEQRMTQRL